MKVASDVVFDVACAFLLLLLTFVFLNLVNNLEDRMASQSAAMSTSMEGLHDAQGVLRQSLWCFFWLLSLCGQWIVLHTGQYLVDDGPQFWRHVQPIGAGTLMA